MEGGTRAAAKVTAEDSADCLTRYADQSYTQVAKSNIRSAADYRRQVSKHRQPKENSRENMKHRKSDATTQRRARDRDNLRNKLNYYRKRGDLLQLKYIEECKKSNVFRRK